MAKRRILAAVSTIFALALLWSGIRGASAYGEQLIFPADSFFSASFAPDGSVYVVGADGALLSSTDQGVSFTRRVFAERGDTSNYDLFTIRFASDGSGWIGGEHGVILHTTDNGKSWAAQKSGVVEDLFRIYPVNSRIAFGGGTNGLLMATTDGGTTWRAEKRKDGFIYFDISSPDGRNVWAVGEFATIIHSSDGGQTWELQHGGSRRNFRAPAFLAVHFVDAQHGWVAGQGGIWLATSDGGKNWTESRLRSEVPIYSMSYLPGASEVAGKLWMTGNDGALVEVSSPLESSSVRVMHPTLDPMTDVTFSGQVGIAVGAGASILRSNDAGRSWRAVTGK